MINHNDLVQAADFNEACELLLELHNSELVHLIEAEEKVAQFLTKHGYLNPLDDPRWITTLR